MHPTMKYAPLLMLSWLTAFGATDAALRQSAATETPAPYTKTNPGIDRKKFMEDTRAAMDLREIRRVSLDDFMRMSRDPDTIVLDARNPAKFGLLHIKGAKNLDFTLFTETELAKVIPSKTTRVLIYCNNNFVDNSPATRMAVEGKTAGFSLNLSTFSSLYGYGYRNVYELGPQIDLKNGPSNLTGTLIGADGKVVESAAGEARRTSRASGRDAGKGAPGAAP